MKAPYKLRRLRTHPRVWFGRFVRGWPILIWLAAVAAACALYTGGAEFASFTGVVRTIEDHVAAPELGKLVKVHVLPSQHVTNGQVVAELDASLIDAQMGIEKALAAEELGTVAAYQQNIIQLHNQLAADVAVAETAMADQKRSQAEAAAELQVIDSELAYLEEMVGRGLMDRSALSMMKARQAALKEATSMYPAVIKTHEDQLALAKRDMGVLREWLQLKDNGDLSRSIMEKLRARQGIHEEQLKLLTMRRDSFTLRASTNGVVARILQVEGDVVQAGTPLVDILSDDPAHVVGFIQELDAHSVGMNMAASVARPSAPDFLYRGVVDIISPDVMWLPGRVSPVAGQQVRGRRVVIRLLDHTNLLPGETVQIRVAVRNAASLLDCLKRSAETVSSEMRRLVELVKRKL